METAKTYEEAINELVKWFDEMEFDEEDKTMFRGMRLFVEGLYDVDIKKVNADIKAAM